MTQRSLFTAVAVVGCFCAPALLGQDTVPIGRGQGGRAGRGGRGGAAGNFPQQTRQLASPDVIARGKAVYGVNCTACHGSDLRGGDQGGPSLLRSLVALSDQHGELVSPIIHGSRQDKGMPAFNLSEEDSVAVAEYIHSVLAQVGRQARPPGSPDLAEINILVGNVAAGASFFKSNCASCHSADGDLHGIAGKFEDPRELQNTWVSGGGGGGRGARGGQGGDRETVSVTLSNGEKFEGRLVHKDDFLVTLLTADGTRRSFTRNGDIPRVVVHDPNEAHKKLAMTLNDKSMHDVTAYLATLK
ncbi:MAG TPA: c-type cytochrome [Bryobacteraceae bacterium]|jgi:cytochrome c oxidase cbb3-type subunit 3|nr:c-type cytochrome [Bryobacteraceae bacterium]